MTADSGDLSQRYCIAQTEVMGLMQELQQEVPFPVLFMRSDLKMALLALKSMKFLYCGILEKKLCLHYVICCCL